MPLTKQAVDHTHAHLLLGESHSKSALLLIQRDEALATALRREICDGLQKFQHGKDHDDVSKSYMGLAHDIYSQLKQDKDGTFKKYKDEFVNFSSVVGNVGYCGSIPCFRFKVKLQGGAKEEVTWIAVFFQVGEEEDAFIHGGANHGEDVHSMIGWAK